jgi:hypothetical protein
VIQVSVFFSIIFIILSERGNLTFLPFLFLFNLDDMIFDEDPASQRASEEATRTIQEQRTEIGHLKKYLKQLEAHLVAKRPISREQLPPIDGVQMG